MTRVGIWMPTRGPLSLDPGIAQLARSVEAAGYDSLMISDHVVTPPRRESKYPFSADGAPKFDATTPWSDAIVAMALSAAVTDRVEIGTSVLVLPQRHPIELAKQLATLDVASGGRVMLGIGAGWQAEEMAALGVPFETRGRRMDEWSTLLRSMWTGRPGEFHGEHYSLPDGVLAYPTPTRHIPIVVGGMTKPALRRAADADGWFPAQSLEALDVQVIRTGVARMRERRGDREPPRVLLRAVGVAAGAAGDLDVLLPLVKDFQQAGVTDFVIDADLTDPVAARRAQERLRDAAE